MPRNSGRGAAAAARALVAEGGRTSPRDGCGMRRTLSVCRRGRSRASQRTFSLKARAETGESERVRERADPSAPRPRRRTNQSLAQLCRAAAKYLSATCETWAPTAGRNSGLAHFWPRPGLRFASLRHITATTGLSMRGRARMHQQRGANCKRVQPKNPIERTSAWGRTAGGAYSPFAQNAAPEHTQAKATRVYRRRAPVLNRRREPNLQKRLRAIRLAERRNGHPCRGSLHTWPWRAAAARESRGGEQSKGGRHRGGRRLKADLMAARRRQAAAWPSRRAPSDGGDGRRLCGWPGGGGGARGLRRSARAGCGGGRRAQLIGYRCGFEDPRWRQAMRGVLAAGGWPAFHPPQCTMFETASPMYPPTTPPQHMVDHAR